ncbi:hypothetical protein K469DRAFT_688576 [Zopfia rhizophila CBS 207.26]|uniref:Beta-lactamase-related domain-containing protein n=1 Tax=Zopfia rhizophila CBS 207.26 TaxID=1314779 RepID=A0A6A6E3V1_9PEZI|nr:hypothetical protein K469DRAFT_688576 [Zopfia rhizophila CBS 207.26]
MSFQRSFVCFITCCLSLISLVSSLPAEQRWDTISKRNGTEWRAYYGIDTAEHEKRSNTLKADGYRIISLSVYGSPSNVNYAAVWARREGVPFETIFGADETTYNTWHESWRAKGYVSTHISVTGTADNAIYAGVMEQLQITNWTQKCGLKSPWTYENATGGIDMTIKGVSVYGTPSDRRYCILGFENVGNQQQTVWYATASFIYNYQDVYAAETQKRFWRPTYLDISEDHIITPLFDDTSVGKWASLDSLTESQLADEINKQAAKGLFPIHLQGGGIGADARFTAIFAEQDMPLTREWSTAGTVGGFKDNVGVTLALDSAMRNFMEANGVRQAQVAVSVNGSLIAERAYTWAEKDRAVVRPDDKFLLASVSKMFTHAATQRLVDAGKLNLTTLVYPFLGYQPTDSRALNITVQHLLEHTAGYDRSISGDIGFIFTDVARSMSSSTPATLGDVIEYVVARPLDFTPGEYSAYSNFGTMLLSYIITNLTGVPYHDFIKEKVLNGLEVELYETAGDKHINDRIVQETKFVGFNPLEPQSEAKVPAIYGGDGAIKEETIGAFSLKASASTIARFIGHNAVVGIGGRQPYSYRDGSLAGARTFSESRPDLDWALTLNTREYGSETAFNDLIFYNIPDVFNSFPLA